MPSPEGPADLVLTGGHVHTIDAGRPAAEAVAVRGERIVAVGSARDVLRESIGPRTRVVDLAGRLLLPGFQDAHVHPISSGVESLQCELNSARGRDAVLASIRRYVDSNPDEPWILGGGWAMPDFPHGTPRREDLDAIVPDRPVYLPNKDGHSVWVNTKALELAGVDRDTPDPADGRIERDPDGTPSGTLHEGAAALVERLTPPIDDETMARGLREAQAYLHSLGITAWQDAIVEPRDEAIYRRAVEEGWLTARVEGAMWWDHDRGIEQVDELVERSRTGSRPGFRLNSVKLMQDGVLETFTGAMLEPYLGEDGRPTGNRGIAFIEPALLADAATRIDAAGLQPHFHAIGDRAVRDCLDAVAATRRANGTSDTRPHIAHIQVIHPDDVPRFAALGVIANAQPLWACHESQMDVLTIPFLGPERTTWQYPFGSLLRAGARLAMGSDWSVSTPDPLAEIEVAVERRVAPPDGSGRVLLPEERITLAEAIEAFTLGSAYVNHLDAETGTIETGKLADLVVVDRDLFAPDAGPPSRAKVLLTLVDGRAAFEDPALG
jgi:predicted amidohydrolase YtcJ